MKPGPLCFHSPLCKRGRASRSDDRRFALDFVRAKQGQEQIPHGPLFQRGQKRQRNAGIQGREFLHGALFQRAQQRLKPGPLCCHSPLCKRGRASRSDDGGFALDFVRVKQGQEQIPHGPLFQRGQKRQRNAGIQGREFLHGALFQRAQQRLKPGPLCCHSPLCKRGRASRSDDGGFALDFVRAKQGQEQIPRSPLFRRGQERRRNAGLMKRQPKAQYQERQAGRSA